MPMHNEIIKYLKQVEKPYRYIGGETGVCKKDWNSATARICLAFPDVYEIGMSNTGLSILYNMVNKSENMLAERVFTPCLDVEDLLKTKNISLYSLESYHPIKDFDVLGITLPYELSYTNLLTILSLSGIPFRASERGESYPLVIGGGPCAFNPEPIADFFDVIVLGDGEKVLIDIMNVVSQVKQSNGSKQDVFDRIEKFDGVYIPALGNSKKIKKAFIEDLEKTFYPEAPIVPYAAAHYRSGVEVARGCMRGCRFCQAGYIYRPTRYRSVERSLELAEKNIQNTGHEDFTFLSLSISDYPYLENILSGINCKFQDQYLNLQFPSLRAESLSSSILQFANKSKGGSFTLAPEAGTERMRDIINKGNTDEDLFISVEKIFSLGWHKLKLYFMIGLPEETEEDLEGIVTIAKKCLNIGRRYNHNVEISVSISTFVPKSHTPFQWEEQISIEEIRKKQGFLKNKLKGRGITYKWHSPEMSFLEGVFARGGRELSFVIEKAHSFGCRFDAWDDYCDILKWNKAFSSCDIDPQQYLRKREYEEALPWDHLFVDLKKDFLIEEHKKSISRVLTPMCSSKKCCGCGVCTKTKNLRPLTKKVKEGRKYVVRCAYIVNSENQTTHDELSSPSNGKELFRYRIKYSKLETAIFLGHLELINGLKLGFRRSGLKLRYSSGFHPRPKLSFGKALSVGIGSRCEYCDVELIEDINVSEIKNKLQGSFPCGINIVDIVKQDSPDLSIDDSIDSMTYEVKGLEIGSENLIKMIDDVKKTDLFEIAVKRGNKTPRQLNLSDYLLELAVLSDNNVTIKIKELKPSIRISDVLQHVFGVTEEMLNNIYIEKTEVSFKK